MIDNPLTLNTDQAMKALNVSTYEKFNEILEDYGIKKRWRGKYGNVYALEDLKKALKQIDRNGNPFDDFVNG